MKSPFIINVQINEHFIDIPDKLNSSMLPKNKINSVNKTKSMALTTPKKNIAPPKDIKYQCYEHFGDVSKENRLSIIQKIEIIDNTPTNSEFISNKSLNEPKFIQNNSLNNVNINNQNILMNKPKFVNDFDEEKKVASKLYTHMSNIIKTNEGILDQIDNASEFYANNPEHLQKLNSIRESIVAQQEQLLEHMWWDDIWSAVKGGFEGLADSLKDTFTGPVLNALRGVGEDALRHLKELNDDIRAATGFDISATAQTLYAEAVSAYGKLTEEAKMIGESIVKFANEFPDKVKAAAEAVGKFVVDAANAVISVINTILDALENWLIDILLKMYYDNKCEKVVHKVFRKMHLKKKLKKFFGKKRGKNMADELTGLMCDTLWDSKKLLFKIFLTGDIAGIASELVNNIQGALTNHDKGSMIKLNKIVHMMEDVGDMSMEVVKSVTMMIVMMIAESLFNAVCKAGIAYVLPPLSVISEGICSLIFEDMPIIIELIQGHDVEDNLIEIVQTIVDAVSDKDPLAAIALQLFLKFIYCRNESGAAMFKCIFMSPSIEVADLIDDNTPDEGILCPEGFTSIILDGNIEGFTPISVDGDIEGFTSIIDGEIEGFTSIIDGDIEGFTSIIPHGTIEGFTPITSNIKYNGFTIIEPNKLIEHAELVTVCDYGDAPLNNICAYSASKGFANVCPDPTDYTCAPKCVLKMKMDCCRTKCNFDSDINSNAKDLDACINSCNTILSVADADACNNSGGSYSDKIQCSSSLAS